MDARTEVMKLEFESDRDMSNVDVTIKLIRHPANRMYAGVEPDVNDLPIDFHNALINWLGVNDASPMMAHPDINPSQD